MTTGAADVLVVLNPHAASGRAARVWDRVAPTVTHALGVCHVVPTRTVADVPAALREGLACGAHTVLAVGGDGTNHAVLNALLQLPPEPDGLPPLTLASLPVGTGTDWVRSVGLPTHPEHAAHALAHATPHPTDVIQVAVDGVRRAVLNVASTGLGGVVVSTVNATQRRRPWTFLAATVGAVLSYQPQDAHILVDGEVWHTGSVFTLVVANGSIFGHGMRIAPHARPDDGLLDVVLVRGAPVPVVLGALWRVYNGSHLRHPAVRYTRAASVTLHNQSAAPVPLDADGEHTCGHTLTYTVQPGAVRVLRPALATASSSGEKGAGRIGQ